jgi:hypothetical protein
MLPCEKFPTHRNATTPNSGHQIPCIGLQVFSNSDRQPHKGKARARRASSVRVGRQTYARLPASQHLCAPLGERIVPVRVIETGTGMSSWKVVTFSKNDVIAQRSVPIEEAFAAVMLAKGSPTDAAMFGQNAQDGTYGCYFSPGAVAIFGASLLFLRATVCKPPSRKAAALLVGDASAWNLLSDSG